VTSAIQSPGGVFISKRVDICSPSKVWVSVLEMNWAVKRWTPSEVKTSVAEMNWAARR